MINLESDDLIILTNKVTIQLFLSFTSHNDAIMGQNFIIYTKELYFFLFSYFLYFTRKRIKKINCYKLLHTNFKFINYCFSYRQFLSSFASN